MDDTTAEIERYLETWSRVLMSALGCSREDVRRWAAHFLRPHPELTLHEPAAKWVAGALVPPEFRGTLDSTTVGRLQREIQHALDQGDDFWTPGSDAALREALDRVRSVIDRHRRALPNDIASGVLATELPRAEALDLSVRVIRRRWPHPVFSDTIRGRVFEHYSQIPFGNVKRLAIEHSGDRADFWHDAFGLNLVIRGPQATRLLDELRSAFYLTSYRAVA